MAAHLFNDLLKLYKSITQKLLLGGLINFKEFNGHFQVHFRWKISGVFGWMPSKTISFSGMYKISVKMLNHAETSSTF